MEMKLKTEESQDVCALCVVSGSRVVLWSIIFSILVVVVHVRLSVTE